MRLFAVLAMAAATVLAANARAEPDENLPAKISERIVAELARADLEAVAADAAKYMGTDGERLKNSFASINNLGKPQYTELVYARDYGTKEKDLIYKIDFQKAFVFVRLLWHVDNNEWRMTHLGYKTENELPFPAGWEHIYPK